MSDSPWLSIILILVVFGHLAKAATHWVVTEDGKLHTQDDSVFSLRRPYDLVSLLEQEKRAEKLKQIKDDLLMQKQQIEATSNQNANTHTLDDGENGHNTIVIDGETDIEQVVYSTSEDCTQAGKPLPEFDLYVGTVLFLPAKALPAITNDLTLDEINELLHDDRLRCVIG